MVALALMTVIISLGIPAFSGWRNKQDTEGQCRAMVRHLSFARMKAYTEKKSVGILWDNSIEAFVSYSVVEDANGDGDIVDSGADKVILQEVTRFPWKVSSAWKVLTFDCRGFASTDNMTFQIDGGSDAAGILDCVVVMRTKIQVGSWNGSQCVSK